MAQPDIKAIYQQRFWPATDNVAIIAALLQHEEDNFSILTVKNNLEEKERMIMRDCELATIMQQQEEEKAQKLTEK